MTTKAFVSLRGGQAMGGAAAAQAVSSVDGLRVDAVSSSSEKTLVQGERDRLLALQDQGYRVKILEDTNILDVGGYRIDVESGPPELPDEYRVPDTIEWRHYLVQLTAPPEEPWIIQIEDLGIDVVESIGAYGLFVVADVDRVKGLRELPFVVWIGPFEPAYRVGVSLRDMTGFIQHVNIGVYPADADDDVRGTIGQSGTLLNETEQAAQYGGHYRVLLADISATAIPIIARLPDVRWIEYQGVDITLDERSVQIVAGNLDGANVAPVVGYQPYVSGLGLSGAGVTIGIVDSGVDSHDNTTMHQDLAGRMAFFVDASGGATATDVNGHGTHVAGIAVGNAATGTADPQGFLLGQGVAPGAQFGSINPIGTGGPFMTDDDRVGHVIGNAGRVMNNSWGLTNGAGMGYTARSRNYDQLVRDPAPGAPGLEHLVIVSAAGNDGPGPMTIGAPWEAKNPIIVGNSLNHRPGEGDADDIRGMRASSSRGPAVDGRIMPTIVAPGTDIVSARSGVDADSTTPGVQRPRLAYTDTGGAVRADYTRMSGTSMAAPHVAGLCALIIEWWRNRTDGRNPSPALVKALLVNSAEDLVGGPDGNGGVLTNIPNNNQGWGRVSLENIVLQAPASDRGPRIFSDQRNAFTAAGQEYGIRVAPADTNRPLRITIAWTDASGAVNANPALVNDLDLEVLEVATGNIFRGNVFAGGFSTPGGTFNSLDNVECVYVQHPAGVYEVTVIAATIAASANPDIATPWQDFALVIDNAQVPAAAAVEVVPVIDRSGSMIFYGYDAITRTASKQFVDLLNIDDSFGVVSFGDAGLVEFPPGPGLQSIVDQSTRDAGKAAVDGIGFGGCTFMGDGIAQAGALLAGGASPAMVLFSDGYDNKGCDQANPAKPGALQAVAALPAGLEVFSCAMGPASDQGLLQQIADATGGRYYYMPAIDDLFEIYNFIRGQVTGDAITTNASAQASSSRMAAVVEGCASRATFTVAWGDLGLRFTPAEPRKKEEISIRLRAPSGRLLHAHESTVRRTVGDGYVAFEVAEPLPGRWFIEVSTVRESHTRYTAACFVHSPLRLESAALHPVASGEAIDLSVRVLDGQEPLTGARGVARVSAPSMGVPTLLAKYRSLLSDIRPPKLPGGDGLPPDMAKLPVLRQKLMREQGIDIFATRTASVRLRNAPGNSLNGIFDSTTEPGSYNFVVSATGISARCRSRFQRLDLVSVVVK